MTHNGSSPAPVATGGEARKSSLSSNDFQNNAPADAAQAEPADAARDIVLDLILTCHLSRPIRARARGAGRYAGRKNHDGSRRRRA
jgi:hypothetical protein